MDNKRNNDKRDTMLLKGVIWGVVFSIPLWAFIYQLWRLFRLL